MKNENFLVEQGLKAVFPHGLVYTSGRNVCCNTRLTKREFLARLFFLGIVEDDLEFTPDFECLVVWLCGVKCFCSR